MKSAAPADAPPHEEDVARALTIFDAAVRAAYGPRAVDIRLFGSRARGDHGPFSDADVVVVLADDGWDLFDEKRRLARLAYDAIVEAGVHIQGWPVSRSAWERPETHTNPTLIRNMRRDGRALGLIE
jgi:predicted nucleotidyltransferase